MGISLSIVSSADLLTWQFEHTPIGAAKTPGLPVLDGSLFQSLGSNTSDRPIVRTTPPRP